MTFEIADTDDGPALQTSTGDIRERADQTMRQALRLCRLARLPPGRYLARAVFSKAARTSANCRGRSTSRRKH